MVLSLLVGVVAPMVAVVPFVFALETDDEDDPSREGLTVSSIWLGCVSGYVMCMCFDRFAESHKRFLILQLSCFDNYSRYESCVCKDSDWRTYGVCVCCCICDWNLCFDLVTKYYRGNRSV